MFMTDYANQMIRMVRISTASSATLAGAYSWGFTDGIGSNANFNCPSGVAYASGVVYVADNQNAAVRAIDVASATVTTVAGRGPSNVIGGPFVHGQYGYADGVGSNALFTALTGITLDGIGNLYVADRSGFIRNVSLSTRAVGRLAGTLVVALPWGPATVPSDGIGGGAGAIGHADGPGRTASFYIPFMTVYDGYGNIVVAENTNCLIRSISTSNGNTSPAARPSRAARHFPRRRSSLVTALLTATGRRRPSGIRMA